MEKGPFILNPNGKLECKRRCLKEGSLKFFGLQVCVDFKKTFHGGILAYFQPLILSQKKNIEFGLIKMCSVLIFFNCNFRKIFLKCNFQWLFFSMGSIAFVAMKLKHHLIACQMKSAICPVMETWKNIVVDIGEYTFLRMSRQCIYVKWRLENIQRYT